MVNQLGLKADIPINNITHFSLSLGQITYIYGLCPPQTKKFPQLCLYLQNQVETNLEFKGRKCYSSQKDDTVSLFDFKSLENDYK